MVHHKLQENSIHIISSITTPWGGNCRLHISGAESTEALAMLKVQSDNLHILKWQVGGFQCKFFTQHGDRLWSSTKSTVKDFSVVTLSQKSLPYAILCDFL